MTNQEKLRQLKKAAATLRSSRKVEVRFGEYGQYYYEPLRVAAKHVNVGETYLLQGWRRYGFGRDGMWEYEGDVEVTIAESTEV